MTRQRKIAILIALAIVIVGAAVALEDRLGPLDPTAPGRRAVVVNDTNKPIHVTSNDYNPLLPPGQSDVFYPSERGQVDLRLVIGDDQGQTIGCIPVKLEQRNDVTVYVSTTGPCG